MSNHDSFKVAQDNARKGGGCAPQQPGESKTSFEHRSAGHASGKK